LGPDDKVVTEGLLQAIPGREVNPELQSQGQAASSH
jgi:hypothetical protein